jgi:hypothetical protein
LSDVGTIFRVWQQQGTGYVSLPRKLRSTDSPKGTKNHKGKWEEKSFQWPQELEDIKDYIKKSNALNYDLYWCPTILQSKQRIKENIPELSVLYADLDEVNPSNIQPELSPSVAWESSPGRYAAVWFLENSLPQEEGENLNKSLTYLLGADKGGWDLTQVLRIPGTRNFKYEGNPKGKLLWYKENYINPKAIPLLPTEQQTLEFEETIIDSDPSRLLSLVSSVKDKLKPKTLSLLIASEEDILLYDRSEKLWELECQLLESGVSPEKVLELVACSHWNKYRGRRDEMKRLQVEVDKALTHTGKDSITQQPNYMDKKWTTYSELMGMCLEQPGWMIEGVWQRTSHGMIAGEPKTYKSVIATDMAVAVASGQPFLGKYKVKHQGPVMYIQEENSPWLVKDRIEKIAYARGVLEGQVEQVSPRKFNVKMPPQLPLYFLNNMGFDFTNQEDRKFLEESIQQIRPVLIIFDPLYLMLGDKDESSSKDIRPVLNWLLYLRYQYKTSVIIIHHWNKSGKSERGGQRMLGSVLFHGWVESAMYTKIIDEQSHQIEVEREFRSFSKPNNLNITFNFGEPGDNSYEAVINTEAKVSLNQVGNRLGEINRTTAKELAVDMGIPTQKVKQRLDQLVKQGKATVSGEIYTIKEEN